MTREQNRGECESCARSFRYYLVHNGFNIVIEERCIEDAWLKPD